MSIFWEIIPKITSPLAVISFGLYIFYLIKKSDDGKKEKSLSVNNPDAQKAAAEKILKDYPDIELATIEDPIGAIEIARRIIDDKLKRHHKTANTLLFFSLIFAVTFIAALIIEKNPDATKRMAPTKDEKNTLHKTWAQFMADTSRLPYAILSLVQHIKIRDVVTANGDKKRLAQFRNYYTLFATRDISSAEHVFEEQYLTNNAEIAQWPGTEHQEIESISDGRYWVKFDLKKNEVHTVVTGASYFYSIPLINPSSTSCFGNILSDDSQWMTCYPNSSDLIDKLTIIIESEKIQISLPPISTYKKEKEGNVKQGEGSCKIFSTSNQCTLIAKWEKISPGECVGFKINWSLP